MKLLQGYDQFNQLNEHLEQSSEEMAAFVEEHVYLCPPKILKEIVELMEKDLDLEGDDEVDIVFIQENIADCSEEIIYKIYEKVELCAGFEEEEDEGELPDYDERYEDPELKGIVDDFENDEDMDDEDEYFGETGELPFGR